MDQEIIPAKKPRKYEQGFKVGMQKIGGREKGTPNKTTRFLKDAVMLAAELEGRDGNGKDELVGFLRRVANEDLRAFVMLLGRVLPLQYDSRPDTRVEVTYRSVAEVRKELEARGISIEAVKRVLQQPMEKVDNLRVSTEIEDE
jgi:hypothetical protein